MNRIISTLSPGLMGLALLSGVAFAGPFNGIHPLQSDRFSIGFGGYWPDVTGNFVKDAPNGDEGEEVDFKEIGLEGNDNSPAIALIWRTSNNTRLQGELFTVGVAGKQSISKDINFGDIEFRAGADLKSSMDMNIARIFYGYSFVKSDRAELGAGLGLHYINLDISVKGKAYIDDIPLLQVERGIDDWAILPNIGGYANYAFSPKWLLSGRVDWISANIGDYDGTLWNAEAAIQYQMFSNFGLGLGYRYLDLELSKSSVDSGDWATAVDYSGPLLFFTANF